jgi:hypothetical protein
MRRLMVLLLLWTTSLVAETMNFDIQYLGVAWIKVSMIDNGRTLDIRARSTGLAQQWAYTDNRYTIDYLDNYLPAEYRKSIHQKTYREESTARYDRDAGSARYHDTASGTLPRTYRIDPDCRDFFSALYSLRSGSGARELVLDANGQAWKAIVEPRGTERVSTPWGKVECDRLRISFHKVTPGPSESSDMLTNNLVNEKNTLYFWITRDARHAPVRAEYKLFPFSVVWKLQEYRP